MRDHIDLHVIIIGKKVAVLQDLDETYVFKEIK